MPSLPTKPGFHEIDVVEHLQQLFEYDTAIFDIKPISFPFDKPEDLKKYIVGDRDSRHVTHPDSESRYLYEKFGYSRVKIIKNYFGDGEPRVLYFRKGNI